ncbi:hypothetical protein [Erwinia amylovora]
MHPSSFTPQPRWLPSRTPVTYRCKPVSYTHLDVYKRQPGDPLSCRLAATRNPVDMHPSSSTPRPRWLPSRTPGTYRCKLPGIRSVAALPQREIRWICVLLRHITVLACQCNA